MPRSDAHNAAIARGREQTGDSKHRWRTPPEVFGPLARAVGGFDVDLCARREDALCGTWCEDIFADPPPLFDEFGSQPPSGPAGVVAWMNPPWGAAGRPAGFPGTGAFVDRAADLVDLYLITVVVLVGASTDALWWRRAARRAACTLLMRRIRYLDPVTGERSAAPPSGSSVFVFRPGSAGGPVLLWDIDRPVPEEVIL